MRTKSKLNGKAKAISFTPAVSGGISFLGGYQVCHNLCMALIGLLSAIGITVAGMPLLFLLPFAVPLWLLGAAMLALSVWIYKAKRCISRNLLIANAGILIAATPFAELQVLAPAFWTLGAGLLIFAIAQKLKLLASLKNLSMGW